jgi:hypothetical protein
MIVKLHPRKYFFKGALQTEIHCFMLRPHTDVIKQQASKKAGLQSVDGEQLAAARR